MKIEVWSDFVCPFCYIGKRRLETALAELPFKDKVSLEFKAFELDPNSPVHVNNSIHEVLAAKYGMSIEEAKRTSNGVAQQASTVGLTFNFEDMKPTNTFDAHRLAKYAQTVGKEAELTEKLLYAYFTESKNIGDHTTLTAIAESVGLNAQASLEVLNDKMAYVSEVRQDQSLAQQYGISGVPYFVINQKYAISGAQPTETFVNALQKVWEEESSAPVLKDLSTSKTEFCDDESCGKSE